MNSAKKFLSLLIAAVCLWSFALAPALQAAVEYAADAKKAAIINDEFVLPYTAGRVTESRDYGSRKVVVNIQDLHCHSEAQRNIARIIASLDGYYCLKQVYQEGDSGVVDTSWLISARGDELGGKMVESLMDHGKLKGSEYYSAISGRPSLVHGIEDEGIYNENVARLNEIMDVRSRLEAGLEAAAATYVRSLPGKYYSARHRKFESGVARYRAGKMDCVKYYKLL